MVLLEALAELIAPTRCGGCDRPGSVLCGRCREALPRIDPASACPRCGAPFGRLVCTECWDRTYAFGATVALGKLEGPLARCIVLHKDHGERRLGPVLGRLLADAVVGQWEWRPDVVTWVPPSRAALARRGFDHGRSIAQPVAEQVRVPAEPLLGRRDGRDQRSLGRRARASNTARLFRAERAAASRVLLVDDVMTTGSTLDAAARVLLAAGAEEVRAAVVARTW